MCVVYAVLVTQEPRQSKQHSKTPHPTTTKIDKEEGMVKRVWWVMSAPWQGDLTSWERHAV